MLVIFKTLVSVVAFFCTMYCGHKYWISDEDDGSLLALFKRWGWLILGFIGMSIFNHFN